MPSRKSLGVILALTVLATGAASALHAQGDGRHIMYVTFSQPVALPGVSLGSGTYIFETPDAYGDHNFVRILTRDRRSVLLTTTTVPMERPAGMARNQVVSLGEQTRGVAPRILVWWPEHSMGRQFVYPAN